MTSNVLPLLRVIANGRYLRERDKQTCLKFAVVATPEFVEGAAAFDALAFDSWPVQITTRLREGSEWPFKNGLQLYFRRISAESISPDIAGPKWIALPLQLTAPKAYADKNAWGAIDALWKKTLVPPDLLQSLARDIKNSLDNKKQTSDLRPSYDSKVKLNSEGAIPTQPYDAATADVIRGVLPIRQSDFAIEEQGERAARILAKQLRGPRAVLEDIEPGDMDYQKKFEEAVRDTQAERAATEKLFRDIINGDKPSDDSLVTPAASLVPQKASVAQDENATSEHRSLRRATHEYGTWRQQRTPPETDSQKKALDRLRGIFYAIQGDPTLSRLFGLTFDFEVEESVFRASLKDQDSTSIDVHLAVAPAAASSSKPVATAARLNPMGFWPVSAFEALVFRNGENYRLLSLPQLVEQSNGLWKMGASFGTGRAADRYDLTSLDLRRSVSSKSRDRDLGEAQTTCGFTILDRGRAAQVARDLALTRLQTGDKETTPPEIVVLHAEELTIGRHVDVAAAKGGTDVAKLKWRSLLRRYVDFDFGQDDKTLEKIVSELVAVHTSKRVLEEISFQVAARLMPMATEDASTYEVITEEAIFLWDGTPGGVLTDGPKSQEQPDDMLPFARALDLPGKEAAGQDLRPAPLRFGYPYVFRFRSMFLGGGSPDPNDATMNENIGDDEILPKGVVGKARPRRFLRHEKIAAPTLALPARLAVERISRRMGYEQADQAIVRSWNDEPSNMEPISSTDPIKGEYVAGSTRALPNVTTRVFIPPEVPFELVVRHSKLEETQNVTALRRGGLRDVAYTPKRPPKEVMPGETKLKPSGFPVAITTIKDTFDPEGAAYRRLVAAADSTERGIPLFQPGGKNTTKDGEDGYLPDPAISNYSIRARIRGSDRYLSDDLLVSIYDKKAYPHVLPLAIVVSKAGKGARDLRPSHPDSITEIATHSGPRWMTSSGTFHKTQQASSTQVQHVSIALFPGEDFDLEVACLPEPQMLKQRFAVVETTALQLASAGNNAADLVQLTDICGDIVVDACKVTGMSQPLTGIGGADVPDDNTLGQIATNMIDAVRKRWPIEEIAAVTKLRVCHAVNKPMMASWHEGPVNTFRRSEVYPCEQIINPELKDDDGAHGVLLAATVDVDLSLVGSFVVIAETVGADGSKLDDPARGRSMISKRSGRWPKLTTSDGKQAYVSPRDVVGFDVGADGAVTLPTQQITLLSVGNLPTHGAVGELIAHVQDPKTRLCKIPPPEELPNTVEPVGEHPGAPVFGAPVGRKTSIALAPLFVSGSTAPISQRLAMQSGALDVIKLTRSLKAEKPYIFKDTLARKLKLSLISVCRHASAFETAPDYGGAAEQLLYRRQPLRRSEQSILNTAAAEVWVNSSARPATPELRRPEPSFVFGRGLATDAAGAITHSVTRQALTRLYFGRSWFSSGEGERIGIVLWPPKYRDLSTIGVDRDRIKFGERELDLKNFEDRDLGAGGSFVTRWGGDPIRRDPSPQMGNFIPPTAFEDFTKLDTGPHKPRYEETVEMPIPRASPPQTDEEANSKPDSKPPYEFLQVSLLTYEPCFDLDREEWFVDIDLKPIRASEPFVRFGLVRFQKQSINSDIMVSEPVTTMMQLLPQRNVALIDRGLSEDEARMFELVVRGMGSLDIEDLRPESLPGGDTDQWVKNFDLLRMPKIRLAVFHEVGSGSTLVRTPCSLEELEADEFGQTVLGEAEIENDELVWKHEFELPPTLLRDLGPGRFVAYVEEIDLRMPASYHTEPIDFSTMFSPATFETSGPRFSARVAFLETTNELLEASP
ncbi:hypothetical protein ACFYE9_32390 [Rhizobium leguminosarum]|uniref:Uncharacterized protein n=2 Tax=Rhizobium leguminosarum TaxID=384 RepID=A0A154IH14_RHILE|nr:hypothetical protein [Rhizobium leguminosarum]KZA99873.1 hypothetical protein A4A59_20845 [Rhizobium leguminosarum]